MQVLGDWVGRWRIPVEKTADFSIPLFRVYAPFLERLNVY